jgi:uncharacterized protein
MADTTDLMRKSPHDAQNHNCNVPLTTRISPIQLQEWVPSKFNARTLDQEGNIILWNTSTGALSVFPPRLYSALQTYLSQKGYAGALDSLGKYLQLRGFIVTKETHEYRQFQLRFGQQHFRSDVLELILLASEDCNFRCKYCYEDFSRGTMLPSVRRNVKDLVLKQRGVIRHFGIHWFGGEPLYGLEAIEDLGPFFLETALANNWRYSVTMTTNGYLLNPETAGRLLAWKINKFQITIDGTAAQHDEHRPGRDGSKTFEVIFENLKSLKAREEDFYVRLRVNFDRLTVPYMDDLLCTLRENFAGDPRFGLAFHAVGKWGGPNDQELDVCGASESRLLHAQFERSALAKGIAVGTLADSHSFGSGVCYAARPYNFIVGAHGTIMKCTVALDKEEHNIVGVLKDGGELVLDHDKLSRWVEPAFEQDHHCQQCHLLPTCQGLSCPLIRFDTNNSPCEATIKSSLHDKLTLAAEVKMNRARLVRISNAVTVGHSPY